MKLSVTVELKLKSNDIITINGRRYLVGEWVVGDGFNLTGLEHLYKDND